MDAERWIDVQEVVHRLNVHEQTVRRWIKRGELPAIIFGRRSGYRIRESDLDAFIAAQFEKGKAAA